MITKTSGGVSVGRMHSCEKKWARPGTAGIATVLYSVILLFSLISMQLPISADFSQDHPIPADFPEENEKTDADPPAAPALVWSVLEGPSNENVLISWSLSADDGAGDDDVSHYAIYYSVIYDGDGYSYLGEVNMSETSFTHILAGDGDWNSYFYYVQANDTSGNANWSGQAGKLARYLEEGKQIASIPLVQEDTTLEVVLQTLEGCYKHVRYYKSSDQSHHWKSYWTFKTYRTLFEINHTMGFWIDMTRDDHLVVAGLVPDVTGIALGHGWNFVGYPSFLERRVSEALADVDWMKVQGYNDVPPFHLNQLTGNDSMRAGEGYWIWVDLPQVWEVSNKPAPSPYIVWTTHADGQTDVPLDAPVLVKFSKEMNTSSVTWTTIPDPGGYSEYWSEGNTLLEIHPVNLWPENTTITFEIYGKDLEGNPLVPGPVPNPWTFTTGVGKAPCITATSPAHGAVNVSFLASIYVIFSEPMNTSSVTIALLPYTLKSIVWLDSTTMVITPRPVWIRCTLYTVEITSGQSQSGLPLIPGPVPNPWSFTIECPFYVVMTDPSWNETGVHLYKNITIEFSKDVNISSFQWTISPDPGNWNVTWNTSRVVYLSHDVPFQSATWYTFTIIEVQALAGDRIENYYFSFWTEA